MIKKLYVFLLLFLLISPSLMAKGDILKSKQIIGIEDVNSLKRLSLNGENNRFLTFGVPDTLSNNYEDGSLVYFNEQFQTYYEATKLVPAQTCTLKSIFAAFYNYKTTKKSKAIEFYVWSDNNGVPGTELIAFEGTIELDAGVASWIYVDVSEYNLVLSGPFWVGHYEPTAGAPTSIADDAPTADVNFYSEDALGWEEDAYDYMHMAAVEYGNGAEPDIVVLFVCRSAIIIPRKVRRTH